MKIGEILRTIADAMEQAEGSVDPQIQNTAELVAVHPERQIQIEPVCNADAAEEPDNMFVPPLQLKIELLKRAVDVDNLFNHTNELDAEAVAQEIPSRPLEEDELVVLKRAAGINPAIIQELANDEPLDD
jgi:hypothetical protein